MKGNALFNLVVLMKICCEFPRYDAFLSRLRDVTFRKQVPKGRLFFHSNISANFCLGKMGMSFRTGSSSLEVDSKST